MRKVTENQFIQALETGQAAIRSLKKVDNIIIMGAVQLYFQHNKQIDYLNKAVNYASSFRGYRKEAAKSFLHHFSGAKFDKESGVFTKGGKIKVSSEEFNALDTWLEWADRHHEEKAFDPESVLKRMYSFSSYLTKTEEEHGNDLKPEIIDAIHSAKSNITSILAGMEAKNTDSEDEKPLMTDKEYKINRECEIVEAAAVLGL